MRDKVAALSAKLSGKKKKRGGGDASSGRKVVEVGQPEAMAMMDGLLSGMAPTVTRQARYRGDPVRVRLSNINFRSQFDGYRRCVTGSRKASSNVHADAY